MHAIAGYPRVFLGTSSPKEKTTVFGDNGRDLNLGTDDLDLEGLPVTQLVKMVQEPPEGSPVAREMKNQARRVAQSLPSAGEA